jgi:hypothetical protein
MKNHGRVLRGKSERKRAIRKSGRGKKYNTKMEFENGVKVWNGFI